MTVNEMIDKLIYLKDMLKADGYPLCDYDIINDACNMLEELSNE